MRLLLDGKNILGYWAAVVLLLASALYSAFLLYDVLNYDVKVTGGHKCVKIIGGINSDLKDLELCLYKNKEEFSPRLCDSIYNLLAVNGNRLKQLLINDPSQTDKCNRFLTIVDEERKSPLSSDTSIAGKINKREIREFIERDKLLRLNKISGELNDGISNHLLQNELLLAGKTKILLYILGITACLIVLVIIMLFAVINSKGGNKGGLQKNNEAFFNIAKFGSEAENREKLFGHIHEFVKEFTGAENFHAAFYDAENDTISFPYFKSSFDQKPETRTAGKGLDEYIVRTGQSLFADNNIIAGLVEKGEIDGQPNQLVSWMGVPVADGQKVLGVLSAQSYNKKLAFDEYALTVMKFAAEVAASAIKRMHYEEQNALLTEDAELKKDVIELNIAELEATNNKLAEAEFQVEKMTANKNRYFSILSHDIKSPFNSLIGFADILVEDFDDLSKEEIKKYADILSASAHNLYNLIDNIVLWSKLQRSTLEFVPEVLTLKSEVIYIIDLMSINAAKKNISLVYKVSGDIKILADKNMLHSTLQNMVSNAIKFTPAGGRVVIEASDKKSFTQIIIADTGVGIKKENLEKLFKVESAFATKGTENEQGTGLGLILVKEMVEKHGGKINVSSVEGKGSAFFIEYPKVI